MGEALPEVAPEFRDITADQLDGSFRPPSNSLRTFERSVLQWFSSFIDEAGPLGVTSPVDAEIDISGMTGWPQAVLALQSHDSTINLRRPPSFRQLADVPGAKPKDVLVAACLLEEAVLSGQPQARCPAAVGAATPTQEIADEFTAWLIANKIVGPTGIQSMAARNGLSVAVVPQLREVAQELGITRSRLKRILEEIDRGLRREHPLGAGLDHLRIQLIKAVLAGPGAVAGAFSRWTSDPDVLATFIAKAGDRRLSRMIRTNAKQLVPAFVDAVQGLVHSVGVIPVARLAEQIDEWDCQIEDIVYACCSSQDILFEDDLAISTLSWGPLAMGVKRSLKASKVLSLIDSYTGAIRHLRQHQSGRLPLLDEFKVFVSKAPDLRVAGDYISSTVNLGETRDFEAFLLDSLLSCDSGLASKATLATMANLAGYSAASVDNYCSTSPLLDYACSGVMRIRGVTVDVARAEELRRSIHTRSPWAQWGWLDEGRIWLETRILDHALRPSPPADVALLLRGRSFTIYGADRSRLGTMRFLEEGAVELGWDAAEGDTWEDRKALHVFVVGRPNGSVSRLTTPMDGEDTYPGDVDACVLIDGRWWLVISVDETLLTGDPCLVPAVLIDGVVGSLSDEVELLWEDDLFVRVRREPGCGVVVGLGECLRPLNVAPSSWIRVAFSPNGLKIEVIGTPTPGSREDLLARVGLNSSALVRSYFSVIGSALGLGANRDRKDVAAAFRRRGRTDLAKLADEIPGISSSRGALSDLVIEMGSRDGEIILEDQTERRLEPRPPAAIGGRRPLGLDWEQYGAEGGKSVLPDALWTRWVSAILRVWLTASRLGPLEFNFEHGAWVYQGARFGRLLDAFEHVEVPEGPKITLPVLENCFPQTGLGFASLVRDAGASGLSRLVISAAGVLTVWPDGSSTLGTFSEALMPAR